MKACDGWYINGLCDGRGTLPHMTNGLLNWYCDDCLYRQIRDERWQEARKIALELATREMYEQPYGPSEGAA